jgi:hypothetical protein
MKTIVISGASSKVGKTTLAGRVCGILPGAVHVKIGHGARKPGMGNIFYPHGTGFERIEAENRGALFLVIESNGILREIDPDLAIYLPGGSPKPSAAEAAEKADIVGGGRIGRGAIREIAERLGVAVETVSAIAAAAGSVTEEMDD